jgi:hypothetical protein
MGRVLYLERFRQACERGIILLTPELFWELFKSTGSISHYLMYKKLHD